MELDDAAAAAENKNAAEPGEGPWELLGGFASVSLQSSMTESRRDCGRESLPYSANPWLLVGGSRGAGRPEEEEGASSYGPSGPPNPRLRGLLLEFALAVLATAGCVSVMEGALK